MPVTFELLFGAPHLGKCLFEKRDQHFELTTLGEIDRLSEWQIESHARGGELMCELTPLHEFHPMLRNAFHSGSGDDPIFCLSVHVFPTPLALRAAAKN